MKIYLVMKRDRPGLNSYYPYKAFVGSDNAEKLHTELTPKSSERRSYIKEIEMDCEGCSEVLRLRGEITALSEQGV